MYRIQIAEKRREKKRKIHLFQKDMLYIPVSCCPCVAVDVILCYVYMRSNVPLHIGVLFGLLCSSHV